MRAEVFTEKDRKLIKLLLENPRAKIYKYHFGGLMVAWRILNSDALSVYYSIGGVPSKLENLSIIVSNVSDEEYKIQYALGTMRNHEYFLSKKGRKILEKLYEGEIL